MLLKMHKKFAKFAEVKRLCRSLFFIKLEAEDQKPYLKETPAQIFFHAYLEIFNNTFLKNTSG